MRLIVSTKGLFDQIALMLHSGKASLSFRVEKYVFAKYFTVE